MRRWTPYLVVGFTGILLVALVLTVLRLSAAEPGVYPAGVSAASGTSPHAEGGAPASPLPPEAKESVCGLPSPDRFAAREAKMPPLEWKFDKFLAYPTAVGAGPGAVSDAGIRHCFVHSRVGAVLAGANLLVSMASSREVPKELLAPGPKTDAALAKWANEPSTGSPAGPFARMQIVAYQVNDYQQGKALVSIVLEGADGGKPVYVSFGLTLVWDGDWKMELPDDWDTSKTGPFLFGQIASLSGYTKFPQQ